MADEYTQMNVSVTTADLKAVDEMAKMDGSDNRSAVVRRLIRQAASRLQYAEALSKNGVVPASQVYEEEEAFQKFLKPVLGLDNPFKTATEEGQNANS